MSQDNSGKVKPGFNGTTVAPIFRMPNRYAKKAGTFGRASATASPV